MQKWLFKNWWVLTINGIIIILFGVVAFQVATEIIKKWVWGFGILILLSGVILIIISVNNLKKKRNWWLWLIEGIFNLAVGVIIIFNKDITIDLFLIFFGIWILILGVILGFIGYSFKMGKTRSKLLFFNALLCVALGVILFYNPLASDSFLRKSQVLRHYWQALLLSISHSGYCFYPKNS